MPTEEGVVANGDDVTAASPPLPQPAGDVIGAGRSGGPFARRRMLFGVVIAALVVGGVSAPAAASTTVKVKGDVATITVPIDCAGCKGVKGPDGRDLAKYWEETAEKAWNDAFAKYPYCSKYKLVLDVKINAKGADFRGKKGDHLVQVSTGNPNGKLVPPPGFEGHSDSAYNQDFDGAWDAELPANGVAHEVGHLLGLPDDYVVTGTSPRKTSPKPGRANTMMADGGPVDKTLIDGVGQQLEKLGLIKCKAKTYAGTVRGHEVYANQGQTCVMDGTGTVSLEVDEHKKLSGTLQTSETAVCTAPPFGTVMVPSTSSWSLSGHADDKELKITAVKNEGRGVTSTPSHRAVRSRSPSAGPKGRSRSRAHSWPHRKAPSAST